MKSDDLPNIPEISAVSPTSPPPRDQVIKVTSGDRASSSSSSAGSSPSELRRRLQDLPSSDEFTPLSDRVAALGRRICRKRELFLRLHGATDRIEESDEWEEEEEEEEEGVARAEGSSGVSRRPMDARARRRARVRLESSRRDDKATAISRTAFGTTFVTTDREDDAGDSNDNDGRDNNRDKLSPVVGAVATRSTRERDYLRLPAIGPTLHRQPRPTSLSEPSTARFPRRVNIERSDVRNDASSFEYRDGHSRSNDLRTVAPFSFAHVRPKRRVGGYRPTSGVAFGNLSSGSESGSFQESSRDLPSSRTIGDPIATLELSSPEPKPLIMDEPTKKMPIMSARGDITGSILPNLLPSSFLRSDDPSDRLLRDDSRACTEFEDSFNNEEGGYGTGSLVASEVPREDIEDRRFRLDLSTRRSSDDDFCKAAGDGSSGIVERGVFCTVEKPVSACTGDADDSPYIAGRVLIDTTEEVLSSQASELFESEGHSRSSFTPKMFWQREALPSLRNDGDVSDKRDQEDIPTDVTNVPMLALNSQDISYSTSAYSQECSAVQRLDPHELIEALSSVSLQRSKRERDDVEQGEDLRRKDAIDASCRILCPAAKGETWRVPRFSPDSPEKALTRVSSKIPVRVPSNKAISSSSATQLSECRARAGNPGKIASYDEAGLDDRDDEMCDDTIRRQLDVNSYSRIREQDLPSRESGSAARIIETRSNTFASKDEEMERETDERASLSSSSPLSPSNAEFGDDTQPYGSQRRTESKHSERSWHRDDEEVAFPGDRDISRSEEQLDRSWRRRSADNVTSATESPYLSRCGNDANARKNRSSRVNSSRDMKESVTWRTEDEWASSNDEEYPDDVEGNERRRPCSDKPEAVRSLPPKCFGSAIRGQHKASSFGTLQPLRSSETGRIAREERVGDNPEVRSDRSNLLDQSSEGSKLARSEDSAFQLRRTKEIPSFASRLSPSTLNLNGESKRKKRKSQERFPFTISEAPAALAAECEDAIDYQVADKDLYNEKMDDQLRERTSRQLQTHPSITRLANAGLEDTVADILYCVAQDQKKDELAAKSRVRSFVQMFSSKFKRASKVRRGEVQASTEVIYENRACQVDSRANSCSSAEEILHGKRYSNRMAYRAARSNPTLVFGEKVLRRTSSLTAISQDHPCRQHDRDDLWVRGFKEAPLEAVRDNEVLREEDRVDDLEDRYSIFLAKNPQSEKVPMPSDDCGDSPGAQLLKRDALISGYVISSARKGEGNLEVDIVSEIDEIEEVLSGCLCLRICRLIAMSKHRLSIREQVASSKIKRSGLFLWKRKK